MTHHNDTWEFTKDGVNYVGFRTFIPLGMKDFYGYTYDYVCGANQVGGSLRFASEYETLPEQSEVEADLPV